MTESEWRFPEFGEGGDHIGARRSRRAFRRCVAFCVFFVGVLWVSEWFLRYDHADRLYLSALTKPHADSARSILRQAVIHADRAQERPSTRYLQALAAREEEDKVLETYERAYVMDPGNVSLAVRYACELHKRGRSTEAAELLREASEKAPDNALPRYLYAAVMPWAGEGDARPLAASFTHIARTNSGGRAVQFPRPLWFSGLPQDGYWYAQLQRGVIDAVCEPFFKFTALVRERAAVDIQAGNQRNWRSRLDHLDTMGGRFLQVGPLGNEGDATIRPGAIAHVYAGLHIRRTAVDLKNEFAKKRGETLPDEQRARIANIDRAMKEIRSFEDARRARIDQDRQRFTFPLVQCGWTFAVLGGLYFIAFIAVRIVARNKAAGTIPHPTVGKIVLVVGPIAIFLLLVTASVLARRPDGDAGWIVVLRYLWWVVLALYAAFGLAYPSLVLPTVRDAADRREIAKGEEKGLLKSARRARRAAYYTLVRRYYGIAIGFNLCFVSLWVVLYRVAYALYPWQFELLILEPARLEVELLERILAMTV